MVIYEDMLHDGIWRNSNLYLEDGRLYANLSGARWIVLARKVKDYTIQHGMGTLIVDIDMTPIEPEPVNYGGTLFRLSGRVVDICIMDETQVVQQHWENPYANYLDAEKNYSKSEREVVDRLNSQTMYY
jgi:hypothetical protein